MQNNDQNSDPHLDFATVEEALIGGCGALSADCKVTGIQCTDDECYVTTNEFEINANT